MKGICPNCEQETDLELIRTTEDIEVRGERIRVNTEYYRCLSCGEEIEDPRSDDDPLDNAYREYRRRHGMMQPEAIRNLRKKYGLTQHEMAKILGWGLATLSRYENGALQDEAHEKTLKLINEPRNILALIEGNTDALPEEKRNRLVRLTRTEEEEAYSFERIFEERFGSYDADEMSGHRMLNLPKLFNIILFFCKEGILKTVLNKLLFYSDFKHFQEYTISISGSRYARIPFGPAPDKWQHYLTLLVEEGALRIEEIFYNDDITGDKLTSEKSPDLNLFSETELVTLLSIKGYFKGWSAKKISDFSHNERGYKETPNGRPISYRYAEDLQI